MIFYYPKVKLRIGNYFILMAARYPNAPYQFFFRVSMTEQLSGVVQKLAY